MRNHFKQLKNQKGMTLIELLAVLVILGIIAAIAIPMIGNYVDDSKNQAKVNEALNIISSAKLKYAQVGGTATYEISKSADGKTDKNDLSGYIDIAVDNDTTITVSLSGNQWSIAGHDAVSVVGADTSATEAELQDYLKN